MDGSLMLDVDVALAAKSKRAVRVIWRGSRNAVPYVAPGACRCP